MPDHVPDVTVQDDPLVVVIFVVLFAAVALLALLFASPWVSRLRD